MISMKQTILICVKEFDKAAGLAKKELTQWAKTQNISILDVTSAIEIISEKKQKEILLGVAIGGDGTFLTLVRKLARKDAFPLMGVNLGSLGFITEVNRDEMIKVITQALKGKLTEEKRPLLDVEVFRKNKIVASGCVFNDAAITKSRNTTMLRFDVSVAGEFLNHVRADGYIISTPTGSTAYALSSGGALIHPGVSAIELVPICSHSLSSRPIVVPMSAEIVIEMKEPRGEASLVYDGQISFALEQGDLLKIRDSQNFLRLLHPPQQKWSEALREKLGL